MRKICVGEWADEYVGLILCPIEKQRKKVRLGTSEHRTHNGGSHERKEKKEEEKKKHLPSCIMFRRLPRIMYEDSQSGSKSINSERETYACQKNGRNDRRCDEVGRP